MVKNPNINGIIQLSICVVCWRGSLVGVVICFWVMYIVTPTRRGIITRITLPVC